MGDRETETRKLLAKWEELEREEGEIEILEQESLKSMQYQREDGEISEEDDHAGKIEIYGEFSGHVHAEKLNLLSVCTREVSPTVDYVVTPAENIAEARITDVNLASGGEDGGYEAAAISEATQIQTFECFTGDENGVSSDMEILEIVGGNEAAAMSVATQIQTFECFTGDENGVSSDMEIEEDIPSPRLMGARVSANYGKKSGNIIESQPQKGETLRRTPESPLKRKSAPHSGPQPTIQITYENLPSESKAKLQDLLHQWSQWHCQRYSSPSTEDREHLESGSDVYSPALMLDDSSKVSVWMDRPSKRSRTSESGSAVGKRRQERGEEAPLYDRACAAALSSRDLAPADGLLVIESDESSRCFNCGSYSHSLSNCPRPRDSSAINLARKTVMEKKGHQKGRTPRRYYQASPGGKFDDIKPGALGNETRQSLGIGEFDPPPWLHRMRLLGYPPGYLESAEDVSAELEIYDGTTPANTCKQDGAEEGEIVERKRSEEKKMTVEFPGINAPIPENADKRLWSLPVEVQRIQTPTNRDSQYQSAVPDVVEKGAVRHSFSWFSGPVEPHRDIGASSSRRGHGLSAAYENSEGRGWTGRVIDRRETQLSVSNTSNGSAGSNLLGGPWSE